MSASDPHLRSTLDSKYERGIERAKRKSIYKLCSDKISSKLKEKGQLPINDRYIITLDEFEMSDRIGLLINNINWVITKMFREEMITKNGSVIHLTLKGEKRFKRTSKTDREALCF